MNESLWAVEVSWIDPTTNLTHTDIVLVRAPDQWYADRAATDRVADRHGTYGWTTGHRWIVAEAVA